MPSEGNSIESRERSEVPLGKSRVAREIDDIDRVLRDHDVMRQGRQAGIRHAFPTQITIAPSMAREFRMHHDRPGFRRRYRSRLIVSGRQNQDVRLRHARIRNAHADARKIDSQDSGRTDAPSSPRRDNHDFAQCAGANALGEHSRSAPVDQLPLFIVRPRVREGKISSTVIGPVLIVGTPTSTRAPAA